MSRILKAILIHVFLPLLLGFLIYLLFRTNTWFHQTMLPAWKTQFAFDNSILTAIFKFHLPDFCWSYSFTSALLLWKYCYKIKLPYFEPFLLATVIVSEIVQIFLKPAFTFDWIDLIAAIVAFFLSRFMLKNYEND
jgi:predicted Na+-dependent transporter